MEDSWAGGGSRGGKMGEEDWWRLWKSLEHFRDEKEKGICDNHASEIFFLIISALEHATSV
jgi:hypothetical protein